MINIAAQNIAEIQAACRQHNVASLELFGCAARENDFTDNSDLDILVTFSPFSETDPVENCIKSVKNVESLLDKLELITNRKVDLVEAELIKNKYLCYFIHKDKVLLYGIPQYSSMA